LGRGRWTERLLIFTCIERKKGAARGFTQGKEVTTLRKEVTADDLIHGEGKGGEKSGSSGDPVDV